MKVIQFIGVIFVGLILIPILITFLESVDDSLFSIIPGLSSIESLLLELLIIAFLFVFLAAAIGTLGGDKRRNRRR